MKPSNSNSPRACVFLKGSPSDISDTEKTIVVTGAARGGTSMVSLVLRGLKVPMGEGLNTNHEDLQFLALLNRTNVALEGICKLIAQRNDEASTWGFKSPLLLEKNLIGNLLPLFRNPCLIMVFRNPLSVAQSHKTWDGFDLVRALKHAGRLLGVVANNSINESKSPVIAVNYEVAALEALAFVKELAGLLRLPADEETCLSASKLVTGLGGGYSDLPDEKCAVSEVQSVADLARPLQKTKVLEDMGLVQVGETGGFVFHGDLFDSVDHLIRYRPEFGEHFGKEVYFRVHVESEILDAGPESPAGYSLYFLVDRDYSIGRGRFMCAGDNGKIYRVQTGRNLREIGLGIPSRTQRGFEKPRISLEFFSIPNDSGA